MSLDNLHTRPYQHPKLLRGVDPQRMNWLWGLICQLAGVEPSETLGALHAREVPVDIKRVRRWLGDSQSAEFFPLSIAELERNVRALLALREAAVLAGHESAPLAQAGSEANGADMPTRAENLAAPEVIEESPVAGEDALRELAQS